MKILHILPELEEGGVERHVLMLSQKQHESGHEVYVVSAGGKMVSLFVDGIRQIHLPVHKKNPVTGIYCAVRLAPITKRNGIDIIHAHSRVPAWIAMFGSLFSGRPYIVTAHAYFSTQVRLIYLPYRRAARVICVSRAVKEGMKNCFADNAVVIPNGLPPATISWQGSGKGEVRFLFVGRLTRLKGLQDIIKILPDVKGNWRLDILGDGPLRAELEEAVMSNGLKGQILFHGFHNDPDTWMAKSDCLLFPSYIEGMPLTLARAIQIGLPVLATDIEPVCEMALKKEGLIHGGDLNAWKNAIQSFMTTRQSPAVFNRNAVTTIQQMSSEVLKIYKSVVIQ
jgi:glycosyltransferase involved in cell wall biosynthesis